MPYNTLPTQNKVFETIYTVSDLQLFYKQIDTIISDLFKQESNFQNLLQSVLSPDKTAGILSYLKDSQVDLNNPIALQEALLKLKLQGNIIPVIHMALAFEPTAAVLKNMNMWFLRRTEKKVLLDITLERQILGGAFISYDGLYKDYTLKTKIDKYFEKSYGEKTRGEQNL